MSKYVGIPFEYNGRSTDGVDCLGLVTMFLNDNGLYMPDGDGKKIRENWHENNPKRLKKGLEDFFVKVDNERPQKFDVLLFKIKGKLMHLGVMFERNRLLHIRKGHTSTLERLYRWENFLHSTYRHKEKI